ncbi:hypothetical protein STEG23_000508 [Scotinomys teguina]
MMFDGPKSGGCDDGGIKAGSLWHPTKAPLGQSEDVAADADRALLQHITTRAAPQFSYFDAVKTESRDKHPKLKI